MGEGQLALGCIARLARRYRIQNCRKKLVGSLAVQEK